MMTWGTLVAGGLGPETAKKIADDLAIACSRFNIDTIAKRAAFVAQCAVESHDFEKTEESLNYTTAQRILEIFPSKVKSPAQAAVLVRNPRALANTVYAGVNGNSPDVAVEDGWRYRGRGFIQLTGKANYRLAAADCGLPFVDDPDQVSKIPGACLSAAAFWDRHGCSPLAEAGRWNDITLAINGRAMLEADKRTRRTLEFIRAFS